MLAIGLMSGTSCDGIDAALIETDGEVVSSFLSELHLPYSSSFQRKLIDLMDDYSAFHGIEYEMTMHHHEAVELLVNKAQIERVDIIGFHGQTILHNPRQYVSWQIGNAQLLATLTNTGVVADFRRRDIAHGGQGAPLVPIFHRAIMHNMPKPAAVLNIGGVSNITIIKGDELFACDIGPGNALIDDAMTMLYKRAYDDSGVVASSGRVIQSVLTEVFEDPFFRINGPKSLDRNHFSYVATMLNAYPPEDIIATLTAITAECIVYHTIDHQLNNVYVCGGGVKNTHLMRYLQTRLGGTQILSTASIGYNPDYIEAQAFGYLAARYVCNLPSSFPKTTGVRDDVVCGVHFQP